ncbi:MAG TPA: class I tRNA ligase family protein, partial [Candidatus Saccharibacteria bacterium]|nr:class I tRNA ligase family protein [Candidatus Saccharibacteria bacterium]
IDIHTGGIDHIPVHHTNEIAQSECATGVRFANYWLHNNHLLADGTKLSKSLGNSYTLNDVLAKGFSAADFRLFVLQSHYRSESNFTWQNLTAAQNRLRKWQAYASRRFQVIQPLHTDTISKDLKSNKSAVMQKQEEVAKKEATTYLKAFDNAMDNDMDTPNALAAVDNFLHIIDTHGMMSSIVPEFVKLLQNIADILGIDLFDEDISDVDKKAVQTREDYRAQKDWDKSDSIRHHLEEKGIYLTDTPHGVVWSRSKL